MEKDGGPDIVRRGARVSVADLSTDPELSGWRPLDGRRLEELKTSILAGKLNQSIMRDPQCLMDSEGKVLTDHKAACFQWNLKSCCVCASLVLLVPIWRPRASLSSAMECTLSRCCNCFVRSSKTGQGRSPA